MKNVHVECYPDEALVKKLGFTRKCIIHHAGRSRVFKKLSQMNGGLAVVDEDLGSPRSTYEKNLRFVEESNGLKLYADSLQNKAIVLNDKLESWIVYLCKSSGVKLSDFKLPDKPKQLHDVIHHSIPKFEALLDHLVEINSPGLAQLSKWLK
ncbi:hypothetical protein [Imperialibacter sp.]|uniref:hypothetical protein n=2 Tax=Imperialibacter sp. TaxID=2038411 RepID=UPI0032ED1ED2